MARRYRIKWHYVVRDRKGRFKSWSNVGRSIRADTRKRARTHPKRRGYGHLGDYLY